MDIYALTLDSLNDTEFTARVKQTRNTMDYDSTIPVLAVNEPGHPQTEGEGWRNGRTTHTKAPAVLVCDGHIACSLTAMSSPFVHTFHPVIDEHQNILNITTTTSRRLHLCLCFFFFFFICASVHSGSGAGPLCDAAARGEV